MKRLARYGLFPLAMFGGVWLAWWAMRTVSPPRVVGITSLATAAVVGVAERMMPFSPEWNRPRGDRLTDLLHTGVSFIALSEVLRAVFLAGMVALVGAAEVPWTLWPSAWPWPVQLALALIIAELPYYWLHRCMHTWPALWRLHAVHHSAPRMYWLNAGRFHPLDAGLIFFTQVPVLMLLGAPAPIVSLFLVAAAIHGLFQHGNLDLRLGPLNHVFAMAELHRWHHARTGPGAMANYGGNLICWDVVFGTRYHPGHDLPVDGVGFEGDETYPTDYLGQLAAPVSSLSTRSSSGSAAKSAG